MNGYMLTRWWVQVIAWSSALFRGNCVASSTERHVAQRGPILHGVNRIIPPWPPIENSNAVPSRRLVTCASRCFRFVRRDGRVHPHPNATVSPGKATEDNQIDIEQYDPDLLGLTLLGVYRIPTLKARTCRQTPLLLDVK